MRDDEVTPRVLYLRRREFLALGAGSVVTAAALSFARSAQAADEPSLPPLPNQNGAPLRLVVPWKYGFKSGKALVKIRFTTDMPATTWNIAAPNEYGFYANVNPDVDHPRWSQARERRVGEFLRRRTLMFNGYADQVASLYAGMDLRRNY